MEDTLIRDGTFSLPDRKVPLKSDMEYEVILVDATESPIGRPKKAKEILFWEEKAAHLKTKMLVNIKNGVTVQVPP